MQHCILDVIIPYNAYAIYKGPAVRTQLFEIFLYILWPRCSKLTISHNNKYCMHYKITIEDYPSTLAKPTEYLLSDLNYNYTGFLYENRLVWDLLVYSIEQRRIFALDILYSDYYIDSIVLTDEAIKNITFPGWQYV